jgi:uncharacterized protein (TIGR02270 family)
VPVTTDLIWDIQEQHLDEAEFLLEMWTNCVDSPNFTLAMLQDGPERRLLAHMDGLLVGGDLSLRHLLLPVLEEPDDDEFRTAAATLTILRGAGLDACERVLKAFDDADAEGRRGLVRALQLTQRAGLIPWLARDIDALTGSILASRLLVLAGHRVDANVRLRAWLSSDDLEVRRAAALLSRHTGNAEALQHLYPSMRANDEVLRSTAIETGLIRGLSGAWEAACNEAFIARSKSSHKTALAWVAMLGDPGVHQRLLAELAAAPTPDLVWAAGLTGRANAVDAVLEYLEHPKLARLAGEVVCAVAGLSSTDNQFWLDRGVPFGLDEKDALPELESDDLDANLVPTKDAPLRLPKPEAIRAWWAQRRDEFAAGVRHSNGRPLDAEHVGLSLRELPTRRRHLLALELAVRTTGHVQIETRAMTAIQYAQMDTELAKLGSLDFQGGWPLAS